MCSADLYCPYNHLQLNIPDLKRIGIGVEAHLSGQILSESSFAIQILAFLTDIQPVTEDWGKSYKIQVFCFWHWSQTFHQQGKKAFVIFKPFKAFSKIWPNQVDFVSFLVYSWQIQKFQSYRDGCAKRDREQCGIWTFFGGQNDLER